MPGDAAVDQPSVEAARAAAQPAGPEPGPLTLTGADLPGASGMAAAARAGAQPTGPGALNMGDQSVLPGDIRPSAQPQVKYDPLKDESYGSRLLHGVLGALGGTQDVVMTGMDATGKPIYSTMAKGPGQQWKTIIAGAMTGLAAGSQAKGPGGPMRSFGAGFQAEQAEGQRQEQQQYARAQQTFENQQKAALNSAQTSLMTNQAAEVGFRAARAKMDATAEDINRMNTFQGLIGSGGKGTRDLGHFSNMDEVTAAFRADPTLHDSHAQGQIVAVPHVGADGKFDGVDAAYVTKDWLNSMIDHDVVIKSQRMENGKLTPYTMTLEKGNVTNDYVTKLQMGMAKDSIENGLKQAQIGATEAEAGARREEAGKTHAETEMTQYELDYARTHDGELPGKISGSAKRAEDQEAEWGPGGYTKGFKPWHKEMIEPIEGTEVGYNLAKQAFADYQAAKAAGKTLPTGAKSMLMLAQHIQNTFGMGKGARQTQAMIEQHLQARGVTDQMTVAFNRFMNGDELSAGQWQDFMDLIGQARDQKWKAAMDDAHAAGFPLSKVPVPLDMLAKYGRKGDEQPPPPGAGQAAPARAPGQAAPRQAAPVLPPPPNRNAAPPGAVAVRPNAAGTGYDWIDNKGNVVLPK